MEQERIGRAMARIEAAAKRIETAAARPPAPTPEPASRETATSSADDADIAARHERLRQEAWAALAEIDSLIETLDA